MKPIVYGLLIASGVFVVCGLVLAGMYAASDPREEASKLAVFTYTAVSSYHAQHQWSGMIRVNCPSVVESR